MPEDHPRAGIPHHRAHAVPHGRIKAMNWASRARRLIRQELACFKALEGVVQHVAAVRANLPARPVHIPAVERDHALDRAFFANNTAPWIPHLHYKERITTKDTNYTKRISLRVFFGLRSILQASNLRGEMRRWQLFIWVLLLSTIARAETNIVALRDVPAYSLAPPHEQRGFFPKGGQLRVLDERINGLVRVRFQSPSGRVIEALCRPEDFQPPKFASNTAAPAQPPAPGIRIPGSEHNDPEWLEDAAGHKLAMERQSKFDNQMLIFFGADWNEACQYLWKELLSMSDFKKQTTHVIKLRVNPEHGKDEGALAAKYGLRTYPSTFMIDKPFAKPRKIDLIFWSFGKMKTLSVEKTLMEIAGGMATQQVPQAIATTNAP
jgi:hypothetical protein